jgi:3-isopropylmalate/(R)-2-methylmalate dehydratase small subunit
MQPYTTHTGLVATIDRSNIDTDAIIPKQFLKRIERSGFEDYLFFDWRFLNDGKTPNPEFVLNQPRFKNATVLVARRNFGSGSSREHAVWALENYGFRTVIAPSFADIFYNNSFKNGVLPIVLTEAQVEDIFQRTAKHDGYQLTVDLNSKLVFDEHGLSLPFEIDNFRRHCMLNGLDDIALTLEHADKIAAYEAAHGITA